jgi:signal transduction histidine kinase
VSKVFRTASFRFASLYVGIFALSALVLGAAVFVAARSALDEQMVARITTESAFLSEEFRTGGIDRVIAVVNLRSRGTGALEYLVADRAGLRLAGEMPVGPYAAQSGWTKVKITESEGGKERTEHVRALVSELGDGLTLAVGDDVGQINEVKEAISTAFAWTVGLACLLGIGGGVVLSRAFLARVEAISRTAEAIIAGDLTQRVPLRGTGDDLDRLAGTLNHMLDRIGALMESLRQVSSDVAHDLRTPLSRLYQRLEDARAHAPSESKYRQAVDAAIGEAEGLLETFSALLHIAQVEGAAPNARFCDVDLSAIADSVADAYRLDAAEGGHNIATEIASGVIVHGDRELLTQAIANLVENAMRHTPAGTRIALRLAVGRQWDALLEVEDDGPGVPEAELSRLTHRFYRSERSRTTPGNGLGLSLVAAVAELHGAQLKLETNVPGFRVSLRFPAVKEFA